VLKKSKVPYRWLGVRWIPAGSLGSLYFFRMTFKG
jgi:hypothetical protein